MKPDEHNDEWHAISATTPVANTHTQPSNAFYANVPVRARQNGLLMLMLLRHRRGDNDRVKISHVSRRNIKLSTCVCVCVYADAGI